VIALDHVIVSIRIRQMAARLPAPLITAHHARQAG